MMKKINLIYWHGLNFGDLLNPYVINKLYDKEGGTIRCKSGVLSFKESLKIFIKRLIKCDKTIGSDKVLAWEKSLLCIGSIINLGNSKSIIWGAGLMNTRQIFHGGTILAVRGRYTNDILLKRGYKGTNIYGDPALLLPLIYTPPLHVCNELKINKIGVIPHWSEHETIFNQLSSLSDCTFIDLRTNEIEAVIDKICSCEFILSSSLHGIIVAHAYGIPALWMKNGDVFTDGIKFKDYFSSVGIPEYDGIPIATFIDKSTNDILDFGNNKRMISLPQKSLSNIQHSLLKVCPFALKEKYKVK